MSRIAPSRAFERRDYHRRFLTGHVFAWIGLLAGSFFLNRELSPERFWFPYVLLLAVLALTVHGVIFARSTLATMGPKS